MRKFLLQLLLLWGLALGPALATLFLHPSWAAWRISDPVEISVDEALKLKEQVLWVDARGTLAYQAGHISGALLLNDHNWEQSLGKLLEAWSPDCIVIVYCDGQNCLASRRIARRLQQEAGLENVRVLKGGWDAWTSARQQSS